MKEIYGDLWSYHSQGYTIAITTNTSLNNKGELVMGKGCAYEAKCRFPDLPIIFGNTLGGKHNQVVYIKCYRIFSFPVKVNWWEPAKPELIVRSAKELMRMKERHSQDLKGGGVIIGRPGCGAGGLQWVDVSKLVQGIFDDKIAMVTNVRGT